MKITETISRECCQQADLRPYCGKLDEKDASLSKYVKFCKHCGQTRIIDSAREPSFEKMDLLGCVIFDKATT